MEKEFEETALKAPSEIDGRALMWTYESLDEDRELEQFFGGIPGFCSSKVVRKPQSSLDSLRSVTVAFALSGFVYRTWSSNLVSEAIKIRRIAICVRAIDAARLSYAAYGVISDFFHHQPALLPFTELGHSLMGSVNNDDGKNTLFAQLMIVCIIAETRQRNERWFSLTMHQLGISEPVLRGYLNHGDSLRLATLIHFTRQFARNVIQANWQEFPLSPILRLLIQRIHIHDIQDTLPELQHDFCSLWNEAVLQRRDTDHPLFSKILKEIRPIYVTLHQGFTQDDSDPLPLCSIPSHRINGATILNKVNDVETVEMTHDPIITSTAPTRDTISPIIESVATYAAPSSPMPEPDPTISHPTDERSRHEVPGMLQPSTQVIPSFHGSPPNIERFSDRAEGTIQGTANNSMVTSMVGPISCPHPSGDAVPQHTGNMTIPQPPSSIPNVVPSPIPILIDSSADHAAPQIPVDATVNQSDHTPHDGCQ